MNDLRFAFRMLLKNPAFTAVAILSLALGIGATTALFSVVHAVLLNPYPYGEPHKIWAPTVSSLDERNGRANFSHAEVLEISKLAGVAETMATVPSQGLLTGDFAPETLTMVRVTPNAFQFLQVPPLVGRPIQPTDVLPDKSPAPVTVITFQLWQRLFSGDPAAIGKTLRINDENLTIVGVMPSRFGWWTGDGLWRPMPINPSESGNIFPIVRLKEGVSGTIAQQQLDALLHSLAQQNPNSFPKDGFRTQLRNYMDVTAASGEMSATLRLLFGAVVFLLLIACANVANLQLARASARVREMAIRLSIGAARRRLLRQLLTESVLLSVIGGACGLLLAFWITRMIVALMPTFYVPNEARIELNLPVLLFCFAVSMATGILFGLAPALQSTKVDLADALKDSAKGADTGGRGGKLRQSLVVAEVALSVVLLLGAGLTIRTFLALQQTDPGFATENIMTVGLPVAPKRYPTLEARNRLSQELLERVLRIPGVESASIGAGGTPFGGPMSTFDIAGHPGPDTQRILMQLVSADYLNTLKIPLKRGRMLTGREIQDLNHYAVINETAAGLWKGEDPINKRIRLDRLATPGGPVLKQGNEDGYVTVIGIVADTLNGGLRSPALPAAFIPYTLLAPPGRMLAVRSAADPKLLINSVRAELNLIDKEQPLGRPSSVLEAMSNETIQPRFVMALFSFFAATGLILAAAGIYSVLSYLVTQRTHEIGVRMALGAQWSDVLKLVLASGSRLVLIGLFLGLLAGVAATRLLSAQLFAVTPTDPISYAAVVVLLSLVALAACYVPARRAARVNPIEALRYE